MTDAFVEVNGTRASDVTLSACETGPWWAECVLDSAELPTGKVQLRVGARVLRGTIDPEFSGVFAAQARVRIVGGGNGWGKVLGSRVYHNDAKASPRAIADDAARDAGEVIATFPDADRPIDFVRATGPASNALERAAGTLSWWVDFDGLTHAGPRPKTQPSADAYDLHHYSALTGTAILRIDELDVWIGSEISEGLEAPSIVRDIEVRITGDKMVTRVVLSPKAGAMNTLEGVIRSIVAKLTGAKLNGLYRYRVLNMGPDGRASLQAVRKLVGLPDLLPVQLWPGAPGLHARLTKGAIVGVQFLDGGDPTQPVVTTFQGRQGPGYVPEVLTLGATDPDDAIEIAYKGCTVKVLTPPAAFVGTVNGLPATGVVTWPSAFTLGTIESGAPRVRVGVK